MWPDLQQCAYVVYQSTFKALVSYKTYKQWAVNVDLFRDCRTSIDSSFLKVSNLNQSQCFMDLGKCA